MGSLLENGLEDEPLYNPSILKAIDLSNGGITFKPAISINEPGENLRVRPLHSGDYDRGFLQLLSQLTEVGEYTKDAYLAQFNYMKTTTDTYYVTVVEDTRIDQIVGTGTLVVERKFIRNAGTRGRLEDVVVSDEYRGKQLGKLLVVAIRLLAEHLGCYKITLDCKDEMVSYYTQMGYCQEPGNGNLMTRRFRK